MMTATNETNTTRSERSERGTVAVEFALILPLLVMLLVGIVQFGRAYNAKVTLTGAVREGARALALGLPDPVGTTTAAAPGLAVGDIDVSTSSNPCIAGQQASVTAEYPFDLSIPFFESSITISAQGVMRCGG